MTESEALFERALKVIPWGTQTNAKRPDAALAGLQPYFIDEGRGCRIRDVDGRWFIDYRSALGPIILGYRHPAVDEAVREQLAKGSLFSMASPLEVMAAEQMTEMIPGLEQVRFLKTGNEANAAAVRLARAHTGRDVIVTCGYHGHGDWFSSGRGPGPLWCDRSRNGVPEALDRMVIPIPYGDRDALEQVFNERGPEIAAMITVPYDWGEHAAVDFLRRARALTTEGGAVLIFDEVLTGFRLAAGGARECFGVIPELSTYAKAMANGFPLAAFGGDRRVMAELDRVVITSTYAGEALSLAAACATMQTIASQPVLTHIWEMGRRLQQGFDHAAREVGVEARSIGLPPAVQFRFSDQREKDDAARAAFFRELYRRGIFPAVPFLLNFAHDPDAIDETIAAFREALEITAGEMGPVISR